MWTCCWSMPKFLVFPLNFPVCMVQRKMLVSVIPLSLWLPFMRLAGYSPIQPRDHTPRVAHDMYICPVSSHWLVFLTFILHIIVPDLAYLPLVKKERKEKRRKVQREKRSHPRHLQLVHGSRNCTCWTTALMHMDQAQLLDLLCVWKC